MNSAAAVTHSFNSSFVSLQSHLSDLPASLASDVFHYNLSQSIGGFISCRLMQQTAPELCRISFIRDKHGRMVCPLRADLCDVEKNEVG